jgi:stalled ribosome rescue protein Dom34
VPPGHRVCIGGSRHKKKYEERHNQHLEQYYDDVISQLGQPEAILIFGPGEAKLELRERLSRSKALSDRTVDIETADKLTDPQIVARVKEHFLIDR